MSLPGRTLFFCPSNARFKGYFAELEISRVGIQSRRDEMRQQEKLRCSRSRRIPTEKPPAELASDSLTEFKVALGLDPEETYFELEVLQAMAEAYFLPVRHSHSFGPG